MIVVTRVEDIHEALNGVCLTIGNFDGVHMGHVKLLQRVRDRAAAASLVSAALTFDPHPRRVLLGNAAPPAITSTEHKLECIEAVGIQVAVVLPFTRELAAREPEDFVREILVEGLSLRQLVIGYDYAFGKGRKGNFELLSALGQKYGFGVERLDPVIINGAVVSSTRIRDMVQAGQVWDARPLLGRFHQVRGTVAHGQKRGRKLGFPTANLALRDELVPLSGVYAVWVEVEGSIRPGVANIGRNPTFGEFEMAVEAHILDYKGKIYGEPIRVHFVQRIRSEKKFSGPDELITRIREDVGLARMILAAPDARP
ncbi:riboflavin biosynthesis protein RibF [Solidesulfovibrio carbinoliphilus subsp. oakridgensis]|uniref:Riboflavin biosynthesis protein n=1 Tax=Solidesulfovibrio carbinoliphilus subsp. oakridgensis TaxID=694327 RepID=G7QB42_9BACT|nr:bifunctional riboflavin kinase/FAD synthetase [Solidesulfovibrio carbinoliphilus]EHJ48784.1 riboflavin biosynthesis protein RibF [Solidesulfovibrio carbinoliphilus subsp. oakridgensis]